jgi:hypothetical protein
MPADSQQKARKDVRRAQADFVRKVDQARAVRRKSFEGAQKAGLSLRDIAEEVGLHRSRIAQIIRGK